MLFAYVYQVLIYILVIVLFHVFFFQINIFFCKFY